MSKRFLLISMAGFLLLNSVVFAASYKFFSDEEAFEDWYRDGVIMLKEEGIITGHADGKFRPNSNINRAETAVMISRLRDNIVENLSEVLINFEELEEASFDYQWDSSSPKVALAMAMAKLRKIAEEDINCPGETRKLTAKNVSENFDVYECQSLGLVPTFYVNEQGKYGIPESGETVEVDDWYGPFEASGWNWN